jgi:SP family myo-inositol transporter-like MFS transporter 13
MLQTVVTITVLGSILGAVASGWLADAFGRKWVIWWSAVVGIGGSVIMAVAPDIYVLLIGRFIVGLVIGV